MQQKLIGQAYLKFRGNCRKAVPLSLVTEDLMEYSQFKQTFPIQLDPQQEMAVQAADGPVLLLAVPGSGKTTVLVTRLGYLIYVKNIPPQQILTMTYTVAAARDMRLRFASFFGEQAGEGLEFRTINGVCSRIIRLYERTMGRKAFALCEEGGQKSAILAELCRKQSQEFVSESIIKAVEIAITYVKNQMLTDGEVDEIKVEGIDFPPIYRAYCKTLRAYQQMDYDDQMVYALRILRQYPEILRMMQEKYRYFCVDEAQDTSKIQHCIIHLLAGKSQNLLMVGDEDQSIYGFRAAYPQALMEFEQVYPQAKVLYMEQNYRSTQEIVAAADSFIQKNQNRHPKHMKATHGHGSNIREIQVYDRKKQYRYLCEVAKNCKRETAVLYRDNDSVLPLIDLLDRQGIPYCCRHVDSLFFSSRIVRDISDIIRLAQDPTDGNRFMNIYYKLSAGISRAAAQEAVSRAERSGQTILEYLAESQSVSAWTRKQCRGLQTHLQNLLKEQADKAVYRMVHFMGYGEYLESRGMDTRRVEILEALAADQTSPMKLLTRLNELDEVVKAGSPAGADCPFVLSTIHSSKGLEYEQVILMDVVDGILPGEQIAQDASPEEREAYEEERRLFYVGMTRAKRNLAIFTFQKGELYSTFSREVFPKAALVRKTALPKPAAPLKIRPQISAQQVANIAKEYVIGTRVLHKTFGRGTLTGQNGDIVTISFATGEDKRISLSAALRAEQLRLE